MTNLEPLTKLSELLRQELRLDDCSAELQAAIATGETSKVLRQVELELEARPDDLLLRALWVKNSLSLDSIPLSVFVSPVSSLLNEATAGSKQVELFVAQSSLEYVDRLLEKGQFSLAADVTEALKDRVGRSEHGLDILLSAELQDLLKVSNNNELPRAATTPISAPAPKLDLDERPIEIPSSGFGSSPIPSTTASVEFLKPKITFAQQFQKVKTPIVLLLAAAIMVVGLRALFDSVATDSSSAAVVPMATVGATQPMSTPLIVANLDLGPDHSKRLDSVNERVKGLEIAAPAEPVPAADGATTTTNQGLNNTEVADLAPISPADKAPPSVAKRLPDVSATAPVEVSNLDMPDRTPRIKDLKVGRDGRLYGPPVDKDPYNSSNSGSSEPDLKTLDGKPVHSYEVQNFAAPRRYRTIVLTRVLSAPSMVSSEVARLQADAKIVVISSMGPWLELRSKNGLRGYVYAQDAILDDGPDD